MEIWKKIPHFSRYEASSYGRIRSLNYKNSGTTKVLKPSDGGDGYLKTMLQDDNGKYKSWRIHKWIASAFLGEKDKGQEINHIDCDKKNNKPENLEYCSRSENVKHAFDNGLMIAKRGSLNGMAKLTEQDVREIRQHAKDNAPNYGRKALAKKYNVSEAQIKDIITRRRNIWPHI
jgi:hypothetical protein